MEAYHLAWDFPEPSVEYAERVTIKGESMS